MQKSTTLKISAFAAFFILALLALNIPYAKVLRLQDQTFEQVRLLDDIFFDSIRPLKFVVLFYPCLLIVESFFLKKPYNLFFKIALYLQLLFVVFSFITYTFFMLFVFGKTVDGFFYIIGLEIIFLILGTIMLFENSFVSNFLIVKEHYVDKT